MATDRFTTMNHSTEHQSRNDANTRATNQTLNFMAVPNRCECTIPAGGYCTRHKIEKTAHFVWLCHTRGEYFRAWEEGRGPRQRKPIGEVPILPPRPKPGTELKHIIEWWQKRFPWFDLSEHADCGCHTVAKWMNSLGPDGCEKKLEQILYRLESEAKKRHLSIPFRRFWAKRMVKLAIRRSRRKQVTQKGDVLQ